MTRTIAGITLSALALVATGPSAVYANEPLDVSVGASAGVSIGHATGSKATSSKDRETPSNSKAEAKLEAKAAATTTNASSTGEAHRSTVSAFVQSLLTIADRDGGIGAEVREIARAQNEAASSTAEAMATVEAKSPIAEFFVGTDWKSLGVLKKAARDTDAAVERLTTLLDTEANASVKADLIAQIAVLDAEQEKLEAFVEAHENSFSLFGWFTKLFAS